MTFPQNQANLASFYSCDFSFIWSYIFYKCVCLSCFKHALVVVCKIVVFTLLIVFSFLSRNSNIGKYLKLCTHLASKVLIYLISMRFSTSFTLNFVRGKHSLNYLLLFHQHPLKFFCFFIFKVRKLSINLELNQVVIITEFVLRVTSKRGSWIRRD